MKNIFNYKRIILLIFSISFSLSQEKLPETFLKDLNGKKVNVHDIWDEGPMAISFWFLACEPCKKEMKFLDEYNKKYYDQGFKVLSINTDNSRTINRVKPFVKSKKYSFTVLNDPKSLFFRKMGGKICPFLVLVDSQGNIINKHTGYNPGDEVKLELEIQNMLNSTKIDTALFDSLKTDIVPFDSSKAKLMEEVEIDTEPPSSEDE